MPFTKPFEAQYDRLPDAESDMAEYHELSRRGLGSHQNWNLVVGLCGTIAVLFIALIVLLSQYLQEPSQLQCAKINSPYSPVWSGVQFEEGNFDNEFPHKSIYRGPPTPEREKAWNGLWLHKPITVPENGIDALNKTGRKWVKSDDGTGYTALIEVFHQLHCLNLIRQYTWRHLYSEEDMPADLYEPVAGRMHVDHCIETLRLSLVCYADVTPVLVYEDPDAPVGIRADFDVHHKCRRFDKLVEYIDHQPQTSNAATSKLSQLHDHTHRGTMA